MAPMGYRKLQKHIIDAAKKPKKKKGSCGCGRSPTGLCVGWHSLSEEKYKERKVQYEAMEKEKKQVVLHARAIDGFGE